MIEDGYVDVEFGTGCLKVTPAHDINDYMLGDKHNLGGVLIYLTMMARSMSTDCTYQGKNRLM